MDATGLSVRAYNALNNGNFITKAQVLEAVKDGSLHPLSKKSPRNFGWSSYRDVCKWLGLPEPVKIRRFCVCPRCGYKAK